MSTPIAIIIGDVHLSHQPPLCRMGERDWYEAMGRPLLELDKAQQKYQCPILLAGDLFDRWYSPVELVNFALDMLPGFICAIPGQHDLPNHNYDEIHRSAYWTLVKAGRIHNMTPGKRHRDLAGFRGVSVQAFPWGFPPEGADHDDTDELVIALVHAYIWQDRETGYTGAPEDRLVSGYRTGLKGFTNAIFGDNHIPFEGQSGDCHIYNCGGMYRRKSDEVDHKPSYGLMFADGYIERVYFDISQDVLDVTKTESKIDISADFSEFVAELKELSGGTFDFRQAVARYLETHPDVNQSTRTHLLQALDSHK